MNKVACPGWSKKCALSQYIACTAQADEDKAALRLVERCGIVAPLAYIQLFWVFAVHDQTLKYTSLEDLDWLLVLS